LVLHKELELVPPVAVGALVVDAGIGWNEAILSSDVGVVVDLPVDLSDLSGRVEESLEHVLKDASRSDSDPETFDGFHDGVDDVRRGFEDVWPD